MSLFERLARFQALSRQMTARAALFCAAAVALCLPALPADVLAETRHMRSNAHTVNGLNAYELGASQSGSVLSTQYQISGDGALQVWWGVRAWKRAAGGTETELTTGDPVAQVTRTADGAGLQSATWVPPLVTIDEGDEIVIRAYIKVGDNAWSQGGTAPAFITASLPAGDLTGTWTVYYDTLRESVSGGKPSSRYTAGAFQWGSAAQDSRIEGLDILPTPPPGAPGATSVYFSSVTVAWTPVGSQEGYVLEASIADDFSGTLHTAETMNGAASSLTVLTPSLLSNTTYFLRVGSRWTSGAVLYASPVTVVTLATPVSAPAISEVQVSSVTLSWTAHPASPPSDSVAGYRLLGSTTNFDGTGAVVSSETAGVGLSALTVSGFTANTTVTFRVAALNWAGVPTVTDAGSTATLAALPLAPAAVFLDVEMSSVAVAWLAGDNPAGTRYEIQISDDEFASVLDGAATTNLSAVFGTGGEGAPLMPNTTHAFRVRAVNHNGVPTAWISLGSTATLAAAPALEAPTFPLVGLSSITVQWRDDENQGATLYVAEISADNFTSVLHASATLNRSVVFGAGGAGPALTPNTTHAFRVKAVNRNGLSTNFLALGSTSTLSAVPAGTGFPAVHAASVTVSWSVPENGASGYRLEASSTAFNGTGEVHQAETADGGASQLIVDTPALAPNTTYFFRLGSRNWNGVLNSAAIGSVSTLANPPSAPAATAVYVSSAVVAWGVSTGGARGYVLEASLSEDFSGLVLAASAENGSVTELAVEGLNSDSIYYLRVGARNWSGAVNYALAGSTRTESSDDSLPPDAVNDLAAAASSATQLRMTWSAPFDPTDNPLDGNYAVQYATWTGASWSTGSAQLAISTVGVNPGDPQSLTLDGLDPNTTYYVRLWTSDLAPNWSLPSEITVGRTLSLIPENIDIPAVYETSGTLSWTALPQAPSTATASGYRIEASSTNFDGTGAILSSATGHVGLESLTVSGLDRNTTYYFRVGSLNGNGEPHYAVPAPAATLASPVTRLATDIMAAFESSVTVRWAALPVAPPSESAAGYRLDASSTNFNGTGAVHSSQTAVVSLSSLTVTGLSPNTTYFFRIGSLNAAGAANLVSLAATSTLAGAPLSAAVESVQPTAALVSWTPPPGGAAGFRVEASTAADFSGDVAASAVAGPADTQAVIAGLAANTTHHFRVSALNWNGLPNAGVAIATSTLANPPQVLVPALIDVNLSSVTARWRAMPAAPDADSAEGYRLEASTAPDFSGEVRAAETNDVSLSTLTVEGLSPGATHYLRVGSLNWNGVPNFTILAATSTHPQTPAPADPAITAASPASLAAAWLSNGNGAATVYELEAGTDLNFAVIAASAAFQALAGTLEGLAPNATYFLRVRARNANGIPSFFAALGSTVTRAAAPGTVSPSFDPVHASSLTVHFEAGSPANPPGTVYTVQLSTDPEFSVIASSTTLNRRADFAGLLPNTTVYARVRAQNFLNVTTDFVALGSTATLAVPPAVVAPAFSGLSNSAFTLLWSSGTSATGYNPAGTLYRAEVSLDPAFGTIDAVLIEPGLSATFTGLNSGTPYHTRVQTINHSARPTSFVTTGSTTTAPSSIPTFVTGSFQVSNAAGDFIDPALYTNTATVNVRVTVQSNFSPGLAAIDTPSMLAIWHMDENTGTVVGDASRHNRTLTLQGSPLPTWQAGHTGTALQFDGSQNYAVTGGLGAWRTTAAHNVWTIEFWFRTGAAQGYLIQTANSSAANGTHDGEITWLSSSGNLVFSLKSDSGGPNATYDAVASQAYTDNAWHHVAARVDATGMHLYVDGQPVASNTTANARSTNARTYTAGSNFVWVGAGTRQENNYGNASRFFGGRIDSVRLSTVALTAAQIAANYQRGLRGLRWGSPDADVSTQGGADFTWTRLSTASVSVTGANGTTTAQSMTVSNVSVVQTSQSGADTNRISFMASDLNSAVATAQYTILVDTTAPSNVGLASLTSATTNGWTLTAFTAQDSPSGLAPQGYRFEASTDAAFGIVNGDSGWISNPGHVFSTLNPNTTYHFRVQARDIAGNVSSPSTALSSATLSLLLQNGAVQAVYFSSVTLSWTPLALSPSSASARGYRVEASSTNFDGTGAVFLSSTTDASKDRLSLPGLSVDTTYFFRVGSLNWNNVFNYVAVGGTATLSNPPVSPAFAEVAMTSAVVAWTLPSGGAQGFRLEASADATFTTGVATSQTANGSAAQLAVSGLSANTTHFFRVGSINRNGVVTYAATLSTSTLAGAPDNAAFDEVFISSVAVAWDPPAGGSAGYRLDASTAANFTGDLKSSQTASGAATSLVIADLEPNTTYFFRIGALNWDGRVVYASSLATATLANAPLNASFAHVAFSSAAVAWTIPTGAAQGFRLEASTDETFLAGVVSSQTANGAATQLAVPGLAANTTYFFRIGSINRNGVITYAGPLSTSTLAEAPDTSTFGGVFISSAALTWDASAGGSAGYRVDASTAVDFTGDLKSSETVSGAATSVVVEGLDANTTYFFRIGALNWTGRVIYASPLATATLANAPLNVSFANVGLTSAAIAWAAPAGGAQGFRLEASTDETFAAGVVSSQTANSSAAQLSVSGLSTNTTYFFRVGSINRNGVVTYAATLSTSTLAGAPDNASFAGVFISSAGLAWDVPGGGSAGYRVDASTAADFTGDLKSSQTASGAATSLVVADLDPNTTYFFRVGALNWSGGAIFASPLSTPTLANAPTGLLFTGVFHSSIAVDWIPSIGGASGYRLEASLAPEFTVVARSSAASGGDGLTVTDLEANTATYLRVGALNAAGRASYAVLGATGTLAAPVTRILPDVIAVHASSLTVRWKALPESPSSASAEGYRLLASSTAFDGTGAIRSSSTASVLLSTLTVQDLEPNTTYHFRVGSLNIDGVPNDIALAATSTLAGAPVAPVVAEAHISSVVISWSPPAGSVRGFVAQASLTPEFDGLLIETTTPDGNATSLDILSLTGDTTYYLRVGSLNWNGVPNFSSAGSTVTVPSIDPIGPDAVEDLAASTRSATTVDLFWSAPNDPTDSPLSGTFLIQLATESGVTWSTSSAQIAISTSGVVAGDLQHAIAADLDPNTTYHVRLWTQDARPNTSGISNGATVATLALVPSDFAVADIATSSAVLSWTPLPLSPASASARGYRVEASSSPAFEAPVTSSSTGDIGRSTLAVPDLEPNTTYYFRLASLNWMDAPNYSSIRSASTLSRAPSRLEADFLAVTPTSATAQWAAFPDEPAKESSLGFRLEASSTGFDGTGTVFSSTTILPGVSTLSISGLSPNVTYAFRVGSLNWIGAPSFTALGSTTTLANVPGAGAPSFALVHVTSVTVAWEPEGNSPSTVYHVEISSDVQFVDGVITASTPEPSHSFTDLSANTTYFARVRAVNDGGMPTAYQALGSTVTRASAPGAATPPFDPVFVSSLTVRYTAGEPANAAGTRYIVEISTGDGFTVTTASETAALSATFETLGINTTYYARVRSQNALQTGSDYVSLGSTATLAVPPGPAVSTFTDVGNRQFTLHWSSGTAQTGFNPDGTLYAAQISANGDFSGELTESLTSDLSATFAGLAFGTVYHARVRAVNVRSVPTVFVSYGDVTTTPSSQPEFVPNSFNVTNAASSWIDGDLFTDTATLDARVQVESRFAPGLAVEDTATDLAIWRFDEGSGASVADASLHNHSLTLKGSPLPAWTAGARGGAVGFDGGQNHATSVNLYPWRAASDKNAWTVQMWFRSSSNAGYLFQAANKDSGAPSGFDLDIGWHNTTGNLSFALRTTGGVQKIAQSTKSYADGAWHFVTAVLDNAAMRLYVDGLLTASNNEITAASARTYPTDVYAWVGAAALLDSNIGNGSRFSSAEIDEVRISTIALDAGQIRSDYELTSLLGLSIGGPAVFVSTEAGQAGTWTRLASPTAGLSGSNGSTSLETFSAADLAFREGADNRVFFVATSLDGNQTTAQFTVRVDTTPPAAAALQAFVAVSSTQFQATIETASDAGSGLHPAAYRVEVATSADFAVIAANSGFIAGTSHLFTGLLEDATYYARSYVRDAVGHIAGPSAAVEAPPAVYGLELSTDAISIPDLIDLNTSVVLSTPIVVRNTGTVTATFRFSVSTATVGTPWGIAMTPAIDRLVIWGVTSATQPATTDFTADDIITEFGTLATGSALTVGDPTAVSVPAGEERTLWIKIGMPTLTNTGDPQAIRLHGTAVAPE